MAKVRESIGSTVNHGSRTSNGSPPHRHIHCTPSNCLREADSPLGRFAPVHRLFVRRRKFVPLGSATCHIIAYKQCRHLGRRQRPKEASHAAHRVTRFAVASRHRRTVVGQALLPGAVASAHTYGASAVEGYIVAVARLQADHISASALYTGTMSMFVMAGCSEVARPSPSRPVMRLAF